MLSFPGGEFHNLQAKKYFFHAKIHNIFQRGGQLPHPTPHPFMVLVFDAATSPPSQIFRQSASRKDNGQTLDIAPFG